MLSLNLRCTSNFWSAGIANHYFALGFPLTFRENVGIWHIVTMIFLLLIGCYRCSLGPLLIRWFSHSSDVTNNGSFQGDFTNAIMKRKVLFVGNGINNAITGYKWENLLHDLIDFVGLRKDIRTNNKPFPLLYEEIVLKALRKKGNRESEIKKFIASRVGRIEQSDIHKEIASFAFRDIITTNYDYNLESASKLDSKQLINLGTIRESRYSLFRFLSVGKTRIWHIHGESNVPSSISLGYEQYSG